MISSESIAYSYLVAKSIVSEAGFSSEIFWQDSIQFDTITEKQCISEAAWVILSAGLSNVVVRNKFEILSNIFFGWQSARSIVEHSKECRSAALNSFNHPGKIDAIIDFAIILDANGVVEFHRQLESLGPSYLESFPYIGPITSKHLAKNLGLQIAKADRHLARIAELLDRASAQSLCEEISLITGDKIATVDLVLWRFATMNKDYGELFDSDLLGCIGESGLC